MLSYSLENRTDIKENTIFNRSAKDKAITKSQPMIKLTISVLNNKNNVYKNNPSKLTFVSRCGYARECVKIALVLSEKIRVQTQNKLIRENVMRKQIQMS